MDRDPRARRRRRQEERLRHQRLAVVALLGVMLAAVAIAVALQTDGGDAEAATGGRSGTAGATARSGPPAGPVAGARPVRVAAVGDTVMGSPPYGLPPDGGASLFASVKGLLSGDVVLGNLEGTLSTGGSSKCGAGSSNCFAFHTPPSYAKWLRQAGFTVMNQANNHALDYGPEGQRETIAALTRVGIRNTGRPGTQATQVVSRQRVAILGFAPYSWADSLTDIPRAKRRVQQAARRASIVIVTFHGGAEGRDRQHVPHGTETYLGEDRGDERAFTHAVIDAGADLVIGHGPHVLRGMEIYKKRLIAYSVGNFTGYAVFGLGGPLSESMVLQTSINPDGTFRSGRIRPVELVGEGVPSPGGSAISTVRSLSRQDFGRAAPRIGADGTIRLP